MKNAIPFALCYGGMHLNEIQNLPKKLYTLMTFKSLPCSLFPVPCYIHC